MGTIGTAGLIFLVVANVQFGNFRLFANGPNASGERNAGREEPGPTQRGSLFSNPIQLQPVTPGSRPRPADEWPAAQMERWQYVGVSSCAAANCHGGSTREQPRYRSSYNVWVGQDRHANAYLALFGSQSQRICRRLGFDPNDSEKLSRCLDCHSIHDRNSGFRRTFTQEDGVSCEACHGPASGWVAEHSRRTWKSLTGDEKQKYGMTDIAGDLAVRAKVCVDCHVGSNRADVNHDLIAAGHPRLNFELAAYHGMIPSHWDEGKDRRQIEDSLGGPNRASFDVQLWALGQLVTAKAAVSLLRIRAEDAQAMSVGPSPSTAPLWRTRAWPELTEYDCYSCHHSLVPDSWRQNPHVDVAWPARTSANPGSPRQNTWYYSALVSIFDELDRDGRSSFKQSLAALRETMSTPAWSAQTAEKVKQAARALEASLAEEIRLHVHRDHPVFDHQPQRLKQLLARVTALPNADSVEWNDAAQAYLAARAIEGGLLEAARASPRTCWDVNQKLDMIARRLAFPIGLSSPRDSDWGQRPQRNAEAAVELLRSLSNTER